VICWIGLAMASDSDVHTEAHVSTPWPREKMGAVAFKVAHCDLKSQVGG